VGNNKEGEEGKQIKEVEGDGSDEIGFVSHEVGNNPSHPGAGYQTYPDGVDSEEGNK